MVFNPSHSAFPAAALEPLLERARLAQGVVVKVTAPSSDQLGDQQSADAQTAPQAAPEPPADADELELTSAVADVFDGVDDLALGLGDLHVERLLVGGVDVEKSIWESTMAALTLNFDVVLLAGAVVAADAGPVQWADAAADQGALWQGTGDVWLRM